LRLHALWKVLVPSQVWERIRNAGQVTVVPAGPLHQLPFEALVVRASTDAPPSYWLDEGPPVRYAVSATTLLQLEQASRASYRYPGVDVLSVSNPTLGAGEDTATRGPGNAGTALRAGGWSRLPPLPGTERESALVQQAFGSARVAVLSQETATESAVRAQCANKRYLHLATHGVVDEATSDVLAGLVLTREGPQPAADGRLQLYEIDGLRLTAQLAVLSACRTAAGKQLESEGVFALARGFHVAGALRVVASLWSVSDASTAQLMGEFFARIAAFERSKHPVDYATALRDAKRAVRAQDQWAQPFHWAPFLLSGAR
jgi:CHAT domain-containing protein